MKKSMASLATVAYTIQEKYQNGVTLFRQEQYWKSNGVELNRNTLANWIIRSSLWLNPLWKLMKDELFKEDIVSPMADAICKAIDIESEIKDDELCLQKNK